MRLGLLSCNVADMAKQIKFKKGDRVRLLSVPMDSDSDETKWASGATLEGVGQVHVIDRVRNYQDDRGLWYDVAGWVVQARNIERVDP